MAIGSVFDFFSKLGEQAGPFVDNYVRPLFNGQPQQASKPDVAPGIAPAVSAPSAPNVQNNALDQDARADLSDDDDDQDEIEAAATQATGINLNRLDPKASLEEHLFSLLHVIGSVHERANRLTIQGKKIQNEMELLTNLQMMITEKTNVDGKGNYDFNDDADFAQLLTNAKRLGLVVKPSGLIFTGAEKEHLQQRIGNLHKMKDTELQLIVKETQKCVSRHDELYKAFMSLWNKLDDVKRKILALIASKGH